MDVSVFVTFVAAHLHPTPSADVRGRYYSTAVPVFLVERSGSGLDGNAQGGR